MAVEFGRKSEGMPFRGVILAEGEADDVVGFDTEAEMIAFESGLSAGAGLYGGDGCGFYTLDDLKENGGDIDPEDKWDKRRHAEIKGALSPREKESITAADVGTLDDII